MTDAEIRQAMRVISTVNGRPLSDERIEQDFGTYKSYLTAIDHINRQRLPMEVEPLPVVSLKRSAS